MTRPRKEQPKPDPKGKGKGDQGQAEEADVAGKRVKFVAPAGAKVSTHSKYREVDGVRYPVSCYCAATNDHPI